MRLGELNTLVTVERKDDDLGLGLKLPYKPCGIQLWVAVEQLGGSELAAAQSIDARANVLVRSHWRPGLRVRDRLVDSSAGRVFNVVAIDNVKNLNRVLRLTCVEIVA